MEKRITAQEAWHNAQYIVGKTAVLDFILQVIEGVSKEGIVDISWRIDSITPPERPIIEMFRNKEVSEYVLNVLVNLGYEVDFNEGIHGKLYIKWGPSKPSKPL